eukprot:514431-Rhodomonas_salina.1
MIVKCDSDEGCLGSQCRWGASVVYSQEKKDFVLGLKGYNEVGKILMRIRNTIRLMGMKKQMKKKEKTKVKEKPLSMKQLKKKKELTRK